MMTDYRRSPDTFLISVLFEGFFSSHLAILAGSISGMAV
ncbi:Uncharacterized protein BM_BM17664 [Brugia malayi]|uniref:Uncharacterized protein n=1 Tax=Brugia malayi TaxID=6279 RepID=A0A4E9FKK8_BRUMA|nr:Uncharacterized protein BM_BM17664 [Brugia malayi]VIO97032.1 Uncharacterized protein BM_BM17664 [Brugia malayi]